ncbi:hypothetical protein DFH28DRAFT_1178675 [Melampsora americana]|nr:hypothetical protein DFH28DRAFT_1178675 [Melampsora americana]
MISSDRTAQLELWREIVNKRHEETKPVTHHLNSIQKCFDKLDSKGFIWSKDSILGIFLQLGLSKNPNGPFSDLNKIIASRVLQGEISSDEIKKVIQNEESRKRFRPVGLMDLPIEVFQKILKNLDYLAELEAEDIYKRKSEARVTISSSGPDFRRPYMTYLHRNLPILNSIQTFSLTSREIYQLCEPWLWQKLQFPTRLPAPINLWTEDILLKRGHHVQSLSITLSENCGKPLDKFGECDPFCDNLSPHITYDDVQPISPKNVINLITCCPNISILNLYYGYLEGFEDRGRTEKFLLNLIPLLSNLKQLRQLRLVNRYQMIVMFDLPLQIVVNLPLLESLTMNVLTLSRAQSRLGDVAFGLNLSKLRNLSQLHLSYLYNINETWCLHNWSESITELTIHECGKILPSLVHRIIHHIAPQLTQLKLDFSWEANDDSWEIDPDWNPECRFDLLSLTDLELSTRNANLLLSFQDCKSVRRLKWTYRTLEHFKALKKLLDKAVWSQLRKLDVATHGLARPSLGLQSQEVEDQLVSLKTYCKQLDLEPTIHRPLDQVTWDDIETSFHLWL